MVIGRSGLCASPGCVPDESLLSKRNYDGFRQTGESTAIIAGISLVAVLIVVIIPVCCCVYYRRSKRKQALAGDAMRLQTTSGPSNTPYTTTGYMAMRTNASASTTMTTNGPNAMNGLSRPPTYKAEMPIPPPPAYDGQGRPAGSGIGTTSGMQSDDGAWK